MHKHILFYQRHLAISTVKVRNGAIESSLLGTLLDDLQLVPVFGSNLMLGHAVLLFLVNNRPAHFFTEAMALPALHGNVGLAFVIVVHLLVGGHAV